MFAQTNICLRRELWDSHTTSIWFSIESFCAKCYFVFHWNSPIRDRNWEYYMCWPTWSNKSIWLTLQVLLKKLQSLDFSPSTIQTVESFWTGRLQQVSVNGVQSEWIELKQGVPQETVIGPLFFNLYVNDLPELMSETAHILQYADDCLLFWSDKKSQTALEVSQDNLCKLEGYYCLNKLNLISNKIEFITFSLKNDKRLNDLETIL